MKPLPRNFTVGLVAVALAGGFGIAWTDASFAKGGGGGAGGGGAGGGGAGGGGAGGGGAGGGGAGAGGASAGGGAGASAGAGGSGGPGGSAAASGGGTGTAGAATGAAASSGGTSAGTAGATGSGSATAGSAGAGPASGGTANAGGTVEALRPRMIFDYDFTSVAAGMPVSGPLSQWYGLTASESAAAPATMPARMAAYPVPRTPGIPAVVAGTAGTAPATQVLGAPAASVAPAQFSYSGALAQPVREPSVWTMPLRPLSGPSAR